MYFNAELLNPHSERMSGQTSTYKNIAAYKFVSTDESFIKDIRLPLREALRDLGTRGTVLLSTEGINLFLCGTPEVIEKSWELITSHAPYSDLKYKESYSSYVTFNRMLVKLKKEIIPSGDPEIAPHDFTGPHVSPETLREWLDEGRDLVLLDTRNDYEVKLGTFENAIDLNIDTFRSFKDAVTELGDEVKEKPVVMFCTGGIRCEKASPMMLEMGFKEVYQLDGGILKYFETVGGDHYDGECFVFDHRVAVDSTLNETETVQCYKCQEPLTLAEQQSDKYSVGEYCPYCYELRMAERSLSTQTSAS